MVDSAPFTAEVFRLAAARPDASPRLTRAADCVKKGTFTWEEVAAGTATHPLALALSTPRAKEKVWPQLTEVAASLQPEPAPAKRRRPIPAHPADDDFSGFTYLEDLAEPPRHPSWPDPSREW